MNDAASGRNDENMRPVLVLTFALSLTTACATNLPTRSGSVRATEQTPTERYEAYRATLDHAQVLEEVLPLTSDAVRSETAKRPPSYRKALLADLQLRKVDSLRVLEERVSGGVAFLSVESRTVIDPSRGTRGLGKGKVVLLREEGTWRVDEETWTIEGEDSSGITPRDWAVRKPKGVGSH